MAEKWRTIKLEDIDPIPVVGGKLLWRPVRRTLDIGAFGTNAYVAPNAGDDVVEEHTEKHSSTKRSTSCSPAARRLPSTKKPWMRPPGRSSS